MSRIRTVKPEFFRHEGLQDLEINNTGYYPMLVFQGLWLQCDRNGVFAWRPRQLKLDILPFLPFDMAVTLEILQRSEYVIRYIVDEKEYGQIPSFIRHQRLSGRESTQEGIRFPLPTDKMYAVSVKEIGSSAEAVGKIPENYGSSAENSGSSRENSGNTMGTVGKIPEILCEQSGKFRKIPEAVRKIPEAVGKIPEIPNAQEREREREKEKEMNKSPIGDSSDFLSDGDGGNKKIQQDVILCEKNKPKICPHKLIISLYHSCCPSLPRIESWSQQSQKTLTARWRENSERQNIEWWEQYFRRVDLSMFLTGRVTEFAANLNWLIRPKNMEKVLNGAYDNRTAPIPERLRNNITAGRDFINGSIET
jgi:hypothetical protein